MGTEHNTELLEWNLKRSKELQMESLGWVESMDGSCVRCRVCWVQALYKNKRYDFIGGAIEDTTKVWK